eukprot:6492344-Amphidinium_carterae.1
MEMSMDFPLWTFNTWLTDQVQLDTPMVINGFARIEHLYVSGDSDSVGCSAALRTCAKESDEEGQRGAASANVEQKGNADDKKSSKSGKSESPEEKKKKKTWRDDLIKPAGAVRVSNQWVKRNRTTIQTTLDSAESVIKEVRENGLANQMVSELALMLSRCAVLKLVFAEGIAVAEAEEQLRQCVFRISNSQWTLQDVGESAMIYAEDVPVAEKIIANPPSRNPPSRSYASLRPMCWFEAENSKAYQVDSKAALEDISKAQVEPKQAVQEMISVTRTAFKRESSSITV